MAAALKKQFDSAGSAVALRRHCMGAFTASWLAATSRKGVRRCSAHALKSVRYDWNLGAFRST